MSTQLHHGNRETWGDIGTVLGRGPERLVERKHSDTLSIYGNTQDLSDLLLSNYINTHTFLLFSTGPEPFRVGTLQLEHSVCMCITLH